MIWCQALVVAVFVMVHLFAGRLRFLNEIPRSRWLSMAGGISVAYVFLHIFPELAAAQKTIAEGETLFAWVEHHAYMVAMLGLMIFYGLERVVKHSQQHQGKDPGHGDAETTTGMKVFWLHMISFATYNALIGYLLVHREEQDRHDLLFFAIAMALHFLVNDFSLRQDHKDTYRRVGRWLLSVAVVVGWAIGLATMIHEAAVAMLFAFLAGGVVLNVLKEELPEERKSRFMPFAFGVIVYAILLLL